MKVTKSNAVWIEIEDGDVCTELYNAIGGIPGGATVQWIFRGANPALLRFELPTDD